MAKFRDKTASGNDTCIGGEYPCMANTLSWKSEALFCFGPSYPDAAFSIPECEWNRKVTVDSEICIVDNQMHFVRGCLDIPIVGEGKVFRWLVWVSISEPNFNWMIDNWKVEGREKGAPCFGWINSVLPPYSGTLNLKSLVHVQPVGERPLVELEPTNDQIAVDQRNGISLTRALEISNYIEERWAAK